MHISICMGKERTTITLPSGLRDEAHRAGINISGIAANAVLRSIRAKKREAGEPVKTAPAATPGSQGAI